MSSELKKKCWYTVIATSETVWLENMVSVCVKLKSFCSILILKSKHKTVQHAS